MRTTRLRQAGAMLYGLLTGAQFRPCLQPDGWASGITRHSFDTLSEGTGLLCVILKPDLESLGSFPWGELLQWRSVSLRLSSS